MTLLLSFILAVAAPARGAPPMLEEARRLSWLGRYDQSIGRYRAVLESMPSGPTSARVRTELAEVLAWAGRRQQSLREIDRALKDAPDLEAAWLVRARVLAWSGRYEEALNIYERYLSSAPRRRDLELERSALEGWRGNPLDSDRLLRAVIDAEPANINARMALADLHSWAGDWKTAKRQYGQALFLSTSNVSAQNGVLSAARATAPGLALTPAFFSNSSGLRRSFLGAEAGFHAADNWELSGSYAHTTYHQAAESGVEADLAGLRLDGREGLRWEFHGHGEGNFFDTGPPTFTGRASALFLAAERTRIGAVYERADAYAGGPAEVIGTFDTVSLQSVRRRVQLDDWSATVLLQPGRLSLLAEGHYGVYHHGEPNWKVSGLLQGFWRFFGRAAEGLETGYQFYGLDARRADPLYFSPEGYVSHGWLVRLSARYWDAVRVELLNNLFYQPRGRQWGESPQLRLQVGSADVEAGVRLYYVVSNLGGGGRFLSRHAVLSLSSRF